jgi:hypothetical protein
MLKSEELDLREGLVYDPAVKGSDSNFWKGDTANFGFDTVKNVVKIGDTGLVGSGSSYSQYLYGDFEFSMNIDSLSPDSNDSEKYFGLRNLGDSNKRGASYFDLSYDTTAGDSSPSTRSFSAVIYDEAGNRQRKFITWDTGWGGGGRTNRFRIVWEATGYTFLVNDSVVATLGDRPEGKNATFQINTSIPQALRISNRSLDTTDTNSTSLKLLAIRHARKVI